jgi:hypothetical protein
MGFWVERSHMYEPEARIYTFTPSSVKGLWVQRVRWNSSRFECAGRFSRAFWFHWEIGFPTSLHLSLVLQNVGKILLFYFVIPFVCLGRGHVALGMFFGYAFHILEDMLYTAVAFSIERDYRRSWRSVMCLPLTPLYTIVSSNLACAYGVTRDLLLFGNPTKFAPEATLIAGRTTRVALLFRVRRFLALTLRSVLYGDVPFGAFWFGWLETPWTPNGFEGWSSGKKPRAIVPWPTFAWLRRPLTASSQASSQAAAAGGPPAPVEIGPAMPVETGPAMPVAPTVAMLRLSRAPEALHDPREDADGVDEAPSRRAA